MVLGILTSIAACPAIIGTTEAVRQGQRQNAKEQHRGRKSNLLVSCSDPSSKARDIHGGTVVLKDNKVSLLARFALWRSDTYFTALRYYRKPQNTESPRLWEKHNIRAGSRARSPPCRLLLQVPWVKLGPQRWRFCHYHIRWSTSTQLGLCRQRHIRSKIWATKRCGRTYCRTLELYTYW